MAQVMKLILSPLVVLSSGRKYRVVKSSIELGKAHLGAPFFIAIILPSLCLIFYQAKYLIHSNEADFFQINFISFVGLFI